MNTVPPTAATPPQRSFSPKVAQVLDTLKQKYPAIGDRTAIGAHFYETGDIRRLPNSRTLGDDRWKVNGVVCSIAGKFCNCHNAHTAPQHNGGPLCEHRIAAMLQERLGQPQASVLPTVTTANGYARLFSIFQQAITANAPQVRLRVQVGLTWDRGSDQANTCTAYLLAGADRTWQPLEAESFPFTLDDMERAIDGVGWQFTSKNRTSGGGAAPRLGIAGWVNEIWYFMPQEGHYQKLNVDLRTRIGAVAA